jgi:hypothetical protein
MRVRWFAWAVALAIGLGSRDAPAQSPYSGTIFLDLDIIPSDSATRFVGASYIGQGMRLMFDRRINAFAQYNAYLFSATFSDGLQIEFQVNPEFGSVTTAQAQVDAYGPAIGRLPRVLRSHVQTSWIHQGDEAFGGGNNNLLIHTGSLAQAYVADGILEETLVHEASHTSLDAAHAASAGWIAAQPADAEFISTYARDNPTREDVAESFLTYLAPRCARARIDAGMASTIEATIPNRLAYLDALGLDLGPQACNGRVFIDGFED